MRDQVDVAASKAFDRVCRESARCSSEYALLLPGDRIVIAISGGLDSLVMLETLRILQKRVPFEFELCCATFDPQFPGFNSSKVAEYCRSCGLEHYMLEGDISALTATQPGERFRRPCVRCSKVRRNKLCALARQLGCNKLALGHHADDLMESFFISLVRGQGLTTMAPNVLADKFYGQNGELRIIRPLALVRESVVKCAAKCFDFPAAGECIYKDMLDDSGDRAWAKKEIAKWQERIPDLGSLMLKSMGKVELDWLLDKRYINMEQ